jgi:hypothetical protein
VPVSGILSGTVLLLMGVLTIVLAFRRQSMGTDGWQVRVSAALTHASVVVRDALSWVPAPVLSLLVLGSLLTVVLMAVRSARRTPPPHHDGAQAAAQDRPIQPSSAAGCAVSAPQPGEPAEDDPGTDHTQPLVKETHH